MFEAGTIIGDKYEIIKEIGRGGMSVVYMAGDINIGKLWAIKVADLRGKADSAFMLQRFRDETDILKRVDHPVLPRIVDIIYQDNTICVVMDYIEGESLDKLVERKGSISQERVMKWAESLCDALRYLHNMNPPVIYRDMKPSNIILKPDGDIKLVDFGTVKEYSGDPMVSETALGTKGFAAPEQYGDRSGKSIGRADVRTDIYCLGMTMKYLMPSMSAGVEEIVTKCTRYDPDKRYQSCDELLRHIKNYKRLDRSYRKQCIKRMRSFLLAICFALCSAAVAVMGYGKMLQEINQSYNAMINEANAYIGTGRYEDAAASYMRAITEVDGARNEAYFKLLKLYSDYLGNTSEGLSCVTYYIDQGYKGIDKDNELLMQVAVDYFELLKDYGKSEQYFEMINRKQYPEAECYMSIAKSVSSIDADMGILSDNLISFEKLNEELPVSYRRLINQSFICGVYAAYIHKLEDSDDRLRKAAEKGLTIIEEYAEEDINAEYYIVFNQYLSLAYESMGDGAKSENLSQNYYEMAIGCLDVILETVLPTDGIAGMSGSQLREAKYCQKAGIYEKLGKYDDALHVYAAAEKEFDYKNTAVCIGHLSLLCSIEELKTSDVEKWNNEDLYYIYERGKTIPGVEEDYRWKKLMVKLAPLLYEKGG